MRLPTTTTAAPERKVKMPAIFGPLKTISSASRLPKRPETNDRQAASCETVAPLSLFSSIVATIFARDSNCGFG